MPWHNRLQVYLGLWRDTRVAVKVLRNSGLEGLPLDEAKQQALTLSNPILANLQKARPAAWLPWLCPLSHCVSAWASARLLPGTRIDFVPGG